MYNRQHHKLLAHIRQQPDVLTDTHTTYRCPDCGLRFKAIDARFEGPLSVFSTLRKEFVQVQGFVSLFERAE